MSTRPSRPRRSTTTSYAHLLTPISLTSSSSSENDSDSDSTKRARRLKKKKTSFVPEQDSESEFEAPPKGAAEQEDEESSDDIEGLVLSDENDGPSGQDEEDMSDIAMSGGEADTGSPGASRGKKSRGGAPTRRRNANLRDNGEGSGGKAPRRSLVVTKSDLPASNRQAGEGDGPIRAGPSRQIPSGLDPQYASYLPHYLPPELVLSPKDPSYATAAVETGKKTTRGQMDRESRDHVQRLTANPFAPEKALIRDIGWEKGKWKEEDRRHAVNTKWGGWYDEIKLEEADFAQVNESAIESRLPSQSFHSRPIPFRDLTTPSAQDKDAAAEADMDEINPTNAEETDTRQSRKDASDGVRQVLVGEIKGQGEQEISLGRFESRALNSFLPRKPGHLLNAGGPVSALAWMPRLTGPSQQEFLAIATISSPSLTLSHPPNLTGSKTSSIIQIWSLLTPHPEQSLAVETAEGEVEEPEKMRLEMGVLIGEGEGEARDLQWCPRGGVAPSARSGDAMEVDQSESSTAENSLGVLAGVFTDGKIKIFVVPNPRTVRERQGKAETETVYVQAKKVLELALPNTSCLSFSWGSWELIAAGCLDGYITIWHVGDALREGRSTVRPIQHLAVHTAAIRGVAFIASPPPSIGPESAGAFDLSGDPTRVASIGLDGSTAVTDLRDNEGAGTTILLHERSSAYALAWGPQSGCFYADDQDDRIRGFLLKSAELGQSKRIGAHRGTIWSLATSPHHASLLSSSSDGTVMMHSGVRALRRRRVRGHFSQKLYSLEFDRETGKWRMRDNWLVGHRQALDSLAIGSSKSSKSTGEPPLTSVLAWPEEMQINKVCWHPNMERSALIASGGNWGCVRIDWAEGVGAQE